MNIPLWFYQAINATNALTSFLIGTFVLFTKKRTKQVILFSLFAYLVAAWAFFFFLAFQTDNYQASRFLFRTCMIAGALILPVFTEFVYELVGKKIKPIYRILNFGTAAFVIASIYTDLYAFDGGPFLVFDYWPIIGIMSFLQICHYAVNIYFSQKELLFASIRAHGHLKQQARIMLAGTSLGYFGAASNFLLWFRIPFPPVLNILILVYVLSIAYAITKLQLMDIEVVIKKTAVYSILTAAITGFFVGIIYLGDLVVGHMTGFQSLWVVFIGAIALAVVIQPLRDKIQSFIDKMFFRSHYDYQKILKNYSQALSRPTDNLDRYAKLVPYLVCKAMKLKGASFWILNRSDNVYEIRDAIKADKIRIGASVPVNNPIVNELILTNKAISIDDISKKPVKNEMKLMKTDLCLPCTSSSQYFKKPTLIAVLSLGQKMSGEEFTTEDISFLQILANQATMSIEYAFIMDELKRNQDIIIKQEKLATLGTTAASIAHELKNPLSYLTTLAQMLPMSWDSKEFRTTTEKFMPAEVDRMKIIIDGILDYSRNKELIIEDTDLSKILLKVLTIVAADIRKRKIEIKKDIPGQIMIQGDHNRLAQVFLNLINNACESMEKAEKKELSVSVKKEGEYVLTTIVDKGCGIPPEKLKNIFDPFFTTKKTGTGLGLPITKKIIEDNKGILRVESKLGSGTTFVVGLPAA